MTNKITAATISSAGTSQRLVRSTSWRQSDPRSSLRSTGPPPPVLTVPIHGEPPKELVKSADQASRLTVWARYYLAQRSRACATIGSPAANQPPRLPSRPDIAQQTQAARTRPGSASRLGG